MSHPRAGQPAQPSDLIDTAAVLAAYADLVPDVDDPAQAGGLRHQRPPRLEPGRRVHRHPHRGDHPGDLRVPRRPGGRRSPARRPRHPRAVRAGLAHLPGGAGGQRRRGARRRRRRLDPHPGGLARDPAAQPPRAPAGTGPTASSSPPSHNPPRDGGFKYNPPHGGPADSDATGWIQDRANALIRAGSGEVRAAAVRDRPRRGARLRLHRPLRRRPRRRCCGPRRHPRRRGADRRRPPRRGQRGLLGRDRRAAAPGPDGGQPDGRPAVGVHDPRHRRQDPDGLLVAERDGLADRGQGRATTSPPATTPTATGTASSPPTAG